MGAGSEAVIPLSKFAVYVAIELTCRHVLRLGSLLSLFVAAQIKLLTSWSRKYWSVPGLSEDTNGTLMD